MKIVQTNIPEVKLIIPDVYGDQRGFFFESWRDSWSDKIGIDRSFVQDNHSCSHLGTLRGLHYQVERPQGKLVRVTKGKVFDVAVDLRASSGTFGLWVGVELSEENKQIMWIPPGFAHGFYVMSDHAEFVYKCTDYYYKSGERTLKWNDPAVGVKWPIIEGASILLSEKDECGLNLEECELYN